MSPHSLIVIGSGPGIGAHVARQFAKQRFSKIALVARNPDQLEKDRASLEAAVGAANVTIKTYSVDIANLPELTKTLDKIGDELGSPEVIFFNAARVKLSKLLEVDEDEMIYDFKISTTSLHETAKWAIPHLTKIAKTDPTAKPSIIVTSSHLPESPEPDLFVLSLTKAAQRNLTQSLAKVYGPQGVHVGLVVVAGMVAPENKQLNPVNIAERAWEFYGQDRDKWALEVVIKEP